MTRAGRRLLLAAVTAVGLCALSSVAEAQVQGACQDATVGGGIIKSSTSGGTALFGMAAGYPMPGGVLGGFFSMTDKKGGLTIKSTTVDTYVGYHCGGLDPNGGPCYDRYFSGNASVTINKQTTSMPFHVEVLATQSPLAPDYVAWQPACADLGCFVSFQLVSAGLVFVLNPDTTTEGCF